MFQKVFMHYNKLRNTETEKRRKKNELPAILKLRYHTHLYGDTISIPSISIRVYKYLYI